MFRPKSWSSQQFTNLTFSTRKSLTFHPKISSYKVRRWKIGEKPRFLSAKKQGKPHVFWVQRLQGEKSSDGMTVSRQHISICFFFFCWFHLLAFKAKVFFPSQSHFGHGIFLTEGKVHPPQNRVNRIHLLSHGSNSAWKSNVMHWSFFLHYRSRLDDDDACFHLPKKQKPWDWTFDSSNQNSNNCKLY